MKIAVINGTEKHGVACWLKAMFGKRGKQEKKAYDKSGKIPVIRSSICTGEQVAGFRDEASSRFQELMLIRTDADYQEFLRLYEVEETEVRREW